MISGAKARCFALVAGFAAILIFPLLLTEIPPLLDYPNHLARAYVLAFGSQDPILSRMYLQHWTIIPNLALDVVMPGLMHILPATMAGRVVIGLALVLPMIGAVVYHRAAFGRWSAWPLGSALIAYNTLLLFGFLNILVALGAALLLAAAWIVWRDRNPLQVLPLFAVAFAAQFFLHIFGLFFLFVLIAAEELADATNAGRESLPRTMRRFALFAMAAAPCAVLYLCAPLHQGALHMMWSSPHRKIELLMAPFLAYRSQDAIMAWVAVMLLLYLRGKGWLQVRRATVLAAIMLFAVFLESPLMMKDTGFIEDRFPQMIALLICGGLACTEPARMHRKAFVSILLVLAVVRTGLIAEIWRHQNADLASLRQTLSALPTGSRLLAVRSDETTDPAYWHRAPSSRSMPMIALDLHLPALAVMERKAFWPLMFTEPTKQPLLIAPAYAQHTPPEDRPANYRCLQNNPATWCPPDLPGWQDRYDYVLLMDAGALDQPDRWLAGSLRFVTGNDYAALFKITK